MRKSLLAATIFLLVFGCTSETENNGLVEIANFYGCNVSYSLGVSASTDEGSRKYFELRLNDGEVLNSLPAEEIASNSALIFYRNLSDEEKRNYTHIKCVVENSTENSSTRSEYEYQTEVLKTVLHKTALYEKVSSFIAEKKYDSLVRLLSPAISSTINEDIFLSNLDIIGNNGNVMGQQILGFYFVNTKLEEKDYKLIRIVGLQRREKGNNIFNLAVSQDESDGFIYGLNLESR